MIILTYAAGGFLGFVIAMMGLIAWQDRREQLLQDEDPRFNPYAAEAKGYAQSKFGA